MEEQNDKNLENIFQVSEEKGKALDKNFKALENNFKKFVRQMEKQNKEDFQKLSEQVKSQKEPPGRKTERRITNLRKKRGNF